MNFNKTSVLTILSLCAFIALNSCNDRDEIKSGNTGEGFIQLNDLKIAIDFVSINGPYLTIGCSNSVKLQIHYGNTVENLDQIFLPETPEQRGQNAEGTFSSVDITIDNNPFCWPYGRNILDGSYFKANNLGFGQYEFESVIKLDNCKKIDLKLEYTGTIFFESKDCFGCARPCSTKDNSFLSEVPEKQVLKIVGQNIETKIYSYNNDNKLSYIRTQMTSSSFIYENNLLSGYTFYTTEGSIYEIQNEDGQIKRIYTREPYSAIHNVSYFIYQAGRIIQSIDSLYNDENISTEKQLLGTTQFDYDQRGNLIKKTIIRGGEIEEEIQYEYDHKINPFYEMYHSWHEDFSPITSPNNIVSIVSSNFTDPDKNYAQEFKFEYDSRGYPVSIKINGDISRSIEYYNYHF